MEVGIQISNKVIAWLGSMGYPIAGMPHEILRRMLAHEARQWQLSPEVLSKMILEGSAAQPVAPDVKTMPREAQPMRRPHERYVGLQY